MVQFSSSTEWWTFQLHADLGTHSAHCADRGLSQVQFLAGCGRACCCAMTGALVGRAENCGVSAVAVVGRRPVLGQGRCARWCNDGARIAWFDCGYMFCFIHGGFWKNVYDFPRVWVDSDPEVNSRRFSPCSHAEDDMAALVFDNGSGMLFAGIAGISTPRAVSRRLPA